MRPFRESKIILCGENFGCGSSREHAVWALKEWGIRCIVAPSFGAIFYSNCVRNGILPIIAELDMVTSAAVIAGSGNEQDIFLVDLSSQTFQFPAGDAYGFEIGATDKQMLIEGLDPIGLTLKMDTSIISFQRADKVRRPWVYI
jgi:3-isopropylmalate/(R)-2-methylmalate dehydratase small subunit